MGGKIPLVDRDGKVYERHLPRRLQKEQFDPPVELIELFENEFTET